MSSRTTNQSPEGDSSRLLDLINGFHVSQAIYVVATLRIPDLLGDRPKRVEDLAGQTGSDATALYRLLRALAAVGLFHEDAGRRFSLTSVGRLLRSDVPRSRAAWARSSARLPVWQAWGHLLHTIRTGRTAFRHVHGQDVWTFREHATEEGAIFDMAMREGSLRIAEYLLSNFDFAKFSHVVDVGGGDGSLLAAILASCPHIKGTLFDQPHVVRKAPGTLHEAQVNERCAIVGGSFFAEVPAGADAYILKLILHDWDEDQGLILLRNCRRAMSTKAKLLIVERLLGPPNKGAETKLSDLNMMVNAGGRERSRVEFARLLRRAGFKLDAVLTLPGPLALLVAT